MIGHVDSLKLCFFVFGFYLVVLEEIWESGRENLGFAAAKPATSLPYCSPPLHSLFHLTPQCNPMSDNPGHPKEKTGVWIWD